MERHPKTARRIPLNDNAEKLERSDTEAQRVVVAIDEKIPRLLVHLETIRPVKE